MKGKHLVEVKIHERFAKPQLVVAGLSNRVRRRHRQLLLDFQRAILPAWEELPLGDAAVQFIASVKPHGKRKPWSETSTFRNMAALAGAMAQMPVYTDFPAAINLSDCAAWAAAMRGQEIAMKMAEPVHQPAMDYAAVDMAVQAAKTAGDSQATLAIMLTWLCAGRAGDATQLRKEDIVFSSICETTRFQAVRILVRRGKAAKLAQPHTIYSIVPPHWKAAIDEYCAAIEPSRPLFTRASERDWGKLSAAITTALRTAGPQFGQRALRRGALQTLAADPSVDLATLRTFSGHTGDDMLLRYLNWGLQSNRQAALAQRAARNLFPGLEMSEPPAAATTAVEETVAKEDEPDDGISTSSEEAAVTTTPATSASFPRRH
jgi:integrase